MTNKTININIDLFPWQRDCLQRISDKPKSIHVIKSKRQTGKSIVCQLIILKTALEKKGTVSAYVLPTYRQCVKAWKELTKMLEGKYFVSKINNSLYIIEFINGSSIQFFSGEQKLSSLQGYTVSGVLIIDEGAFIDEEVFENIMPWTNVHNPLIIIVSTPQYKIGTFYDLYCQGLDADNQNVCSFDFCSYDTTALLSPEKLEFYRKTLPVNTFKAHYLGQFIENQGAVFGNFDGCVRRKGAETQPFNYIVFGVDWGSGQGQDYTAITIMTDNKQVLDIKYFNDKEPLDTIDYIIELAKVYKPRKVVAEKNSIGEIYLSLLRKKLKDKGLDIPVVPFITTNESKFQIVSELQVEIQNSTISLPFDEQLFIQLSGYEQTLTANNKPQFNAKSGLHDDIIMSIMIALDSVLVKKKSTFI